MLISIVIYPLVGLAAGLSAGLFGVGGGLIIVPALVLCFTALGVADGVIMPLAIGTSLSTIVVTSLSSVRAHHKMGNVDWACWKALSPGIVLGVIFGVQAVAVLPAPLLKLSFGLFALFIAGQMMLAYQPSGGRALPGLTGLSVVGLIIGFFSALFGIGGGSMSVPYLSWCNVRMQVAVATSAACGLPIAIVGALTNVLVGYDDPQLPALSSGFIYWPAFAGIAVCSIPAAIAGARLAQHLPAEQLKRYFAVFLACVGGGFILGAV